MGEALTVLGSLPAQSAKPCFQQMGFTDPKPNTFVSFYKQRNLLKLAVDAKLEKVLLMLHNFCQFCAKQSFS